MPRKTAGLLALLLAACSATRCPPPADSPERAELRVRLQPLIQRSPCPGPPTPQAFQARELELAGRKEAFLARVRSSLFVEDLIQVEREDEAMNRGVMVDCAMSFWDRPEDPENVAATPARLEAERQALKAAEAAFSRATAACDDDG